MYCGKEVVVILDVGRESLGKRFEVVVKEGGDSFDRGASAENDGSSGITRYMNF